MNETPFRRPWGKSFLFQPTKPKVVEKGLRAWSLRVLRLCIWSLFCFYIVLAPVVSRPIYDFFLWSPRIQAPTGNYSGQFYGALRREEAFVPVSNKPGAPLLHAWYFKQPNAKRVILLHHGQGGYLVTYSCVVKEWLDMGYSVAVYDYEGYGRSTGTPSIKGIAKDGEAVYNWLIAEKSVQPKDLVHVGWSLGTGVAANVAQQHPCAGIILMSPYASLLEVGRARLPILNYYPDWLINYDDLGVREPFKKAHPPALMFHGAQDGCIAVEQADSIAATADKKGLTYIRYEDGGHTDFYHRNRDRTIDAIGKFMRSL